MLAHKFKTLIKVASNGKSIHAINALKNMDWYQMLSS